MVMKKGQISMELVVLLGFVLIFFIPLLLISQGKVRELNQELVTLQAQTAASRIASTVNSIGYMGTGSSMILDIYLPAVAKVSFTEHGEIVVFVPSLMGDNEIVGFSAFNLDSLIIESGGYYRFEILSLGDKISIIPYIPEKTE